MKKLHLTSFLSGISFAIIVLTIFAFTSKHQAGFINLGNTTSILTGDPLTPATAIQYRNNYKTVYPGAIQAVNISVQQLDAINRTVSAMNSDLTNVSGFRLYYGAETNNPDSKVVSITYPINKELRQETPASGMFMAEGFSSKYNLPCPSFCD